MSLGQTEIQSPGFKFEMEAVRVHVRHFANVEPETLEDDLCVYYESARAKLGARITCFFQDQHMGDKMREVPRNVKRSGESAGPSTDDKNVTLLHIALTRK